MRVVSLVPSWTETLLECGVEVVGRTRFCIHPEVSAKSLPVVGGTKDLDFAKLEALKPDLLLLDKEENLPWMSEKKAWQVHCTHVRNTDDVPCELDELAKVLSNQRLSKLAKDWRIALETPAYPKKNVADLPGVLQWVREPQCEPEEIIYLIWRGPWMAAARDTFVGSMLTQVGFGGRIPAFSEKYPKLDLGNFSPEKTLLLFASEPYPFAKKAKELLGLDFPSAIVDGEAYSWFGLRSLRFLQESK
jgi:ABC-type Fe3+-hydroxamate transport system substrate-binding protein